MIGTFDTGLVEDFIRAFATTAQMTLHVRLRSGRSPHHVVEAEFKALAKALGDACSLTGPRNDPQHEGNALTVGAPTIAVLDYGMGNLHSVSRAIETVGGSATVTAERREVGVADALVIPGVGAFGACVRALAERGLDGADPRFRRLRPAGVRRVPRDAGVVQGERRGPRRGIVDRRRRGRAGFRRT